jgi:hypothetical protein
MKALTLLIPFLMLAGCTGPADAPAPPQPEPIPPDHYALPFRISLAAHALGVSGAFPGSGTTLEFDIDSGAIVVIAYLNWTCPNMSACEAGFTLYDEQSPGDSRSVSGDSPLQLAWADPQQGDWKVIANGSNTNPAVTYEASGTLDVVVHYHQGAGPG